MIYSSIDILVAAVIRGYSGFGFSMIAVICLSIVMPPVEVVPVILVLEVVASAWLIPQAWRQIHWKSISWLSLGVLLGTPVGVYLLAHIATKSMRIAIAVVVFSLALILLRGFVLLTVPGRFKIMMTGLVSGILNGAATIGGPPVILFYLSTPIKIAVSRASMIAFFLVTDIYAIMLCVNQGLVTTATGKICAATLIPLILGLRIGKHFFSHSKAEVFRRKVLFLLMALALTALVRSIWV